MLRIQQPAERKKDANMTYAYRPLFPIGIATVALASGIVIGGQIGARIASRIFQQTIELTLAVLFILMASLTLYHTVV